MKKIAKISFNRLQVMFSEFFGLGRAVTMSAVIFTALVVVSAVFWFFYSAPPSTIVISTGQEGTMFHRNAKKYAEILKRKNVTLKILTSSGSEENLKRLADPNVHVDIGFVQGGIADRVKADNLVSLGSIAYQPIYVFYRGDKPVELLSQLKGKRVAVGASGSGAQILAKKLLSMNGIEPGGETQLLEIDSDDAAKEMLAGKIDAIFLMSESAEGKTIRTLMRAPQVHLYNFIQADGYVRRIHYLNKLELPRGSLNFGKNLPAENVSLVGPSIELIARNDLHPALSDLLLEAAREVHGRRGLLRKQGEFPAPHEREYPISEDAQRYYKSGKSFLYRALPYTLASLLSRLLVAFVPMLVILIPGIKIIPKIYRWRINLGIYRWYRALLGVEQELVGELTPQKHEELRERIDYIEQVVNGMRVPASFAEQFYVLRGHIGFVRERLMRKSQSADAV
ncbi:MAG: C4-dicarboxylate ABC transporter substrate-binding protein [Oxalobacter sp.]|nr:MAG: C4-dicarboxylate ABC transporter substrate-binding protein [Oxalobacter sp.]